MGMVRKVAGVAAGVITAGLVIALTEWLGHVLLRGDAVFAAAIAGYALGAAAGTFVAARLAGASVSIAVPLVLAALAAVNLFSFPHPAWFAPAAVTALAIGWYLGGRMGRARIAP